MSDSLPEAGHAFLCGPRVHVKQMETSSPMYRYDRFFADTDKWMDTYGIFLHSRADNNGCLKLLRFFASHDHCFHESQLFEVDIEKEKEWKSGARSKKLITLNH